MTTVYYVTHPEHLSIKEPGIARLILSREEAAIGQTVTEPATRTPVVDLAIPINGLLELHGMLSRAIEDLEKKGLVRRNPTSTNSGEAPKAKSSGA